jgi:UDP-N-acetylglucosamine 2-epimerase (non-hydrolysing)
MATPLPVSYPPGALLLIAGTRPEAHKLAPLARALAWPHRCCWTGQHPEIPAETVDLDWLQLPSLPHPLPRRQLERALLHSILGLLSRQPAAAVVVQGDTASTHAGAIAARQTGVPLIHLEAGLRSSDLRSPFPEEIYRRRIARIADLHLAPSERAVDQLRAESIPPGRIRLVGSTAVDGVRALPALQPASARFDLLVDIHRRENAGHALKRLAHALCALAESGWRIGLLAHPNGSWCRRWHEVLGPCDGIQRLPLLSRTEWLALARQARAVLSDSGGAAEELPYLGVPLLVYRHSCERIEAIEDGHAVRIDPHQPLALAARICRAIDRQRWPAAWPFSAASPYGDGRAGRRAALAIMDLLRPVAAGLAAERMTA